MAVTVVMNAVGSALNHDLTLVEEDDHGQGIAGCILGHLAAIARKKGVSQFKAEMLPQNKAMLAVFSRSGLPMKQNFADGIIHVTLSSAS